VLVLRSRRLGEVVQPSGARSTAVTARLLRRIDPAVATAFLERPEREGRDEELLARHDADPHLRPHILSVRPPADAPVPGRLERDLAVVAAAMEGGRQAALDLLGPRPPAAG